MASDKSKKLKNWKDQFKYLSEEELPAIVLGIHVGYERGYETRYIDKLKPGVREWKLIAHQTAGLCCHQHYIIGTVLKPKPNVAKIIQTINDSWLDSCCGAFSVSLDEILLYRQQLQSLLGVDCNDSYSHFEEGIGPIDCDNALENLRKLTSEKFPKTVDKLDDAFLQFDNVQEKLIGSIGRWSLFILMQNCD